MLAVMHSQNHKGKKMEKLTELQTRESIAKNYAKIAQESNSCGCSSGGCCGTSDEISSQLGYSKEQLSAIPKESNKGLGCGNPINIASLKKGEVVLDLGSGAGLDCFLASIEVGEKGFVIGVDMTREMVAKARENAHKNGYQNVDFRLGEIEHLPVADETVDVIISNCVINLALDKQQVFHEAFRVLKNGGRLAISDIVLSQPIPKEMISLESFSSCIAGASCVEDLKVMLQNAGFKNISIEPKDESKAFIQHWSSRIENFIVSANIRAMK